MATFFRRLLGRRDHKYAPLAGGQHVGGLSTGDPKSGNPWTKKHIGMLMMLGALAAVAGVFTIGYVVRRRYRRYAFIR